MIRAVTFDLWQTLISEKPEEEERRRALRYGRMLAILRGTGNPASLEDLKRAYHACGEWLREVWKKEKDVPTRKQVEFIVKRLDGNLPLNPKEWEKLEEAYRSPIQDIPPILLPGVRETLKALRDSGYSLGLICNTGRTPGKALRPILDGMGLGPYFLSEAFSDELEIRKPNPRIFLGVLSQLKVEPEEALHVGDIAETDVAGAKRTGMMALHLVREGSEGSPDADGLIRSIVEVPGWVRGK